MWRRSQRRKPLLSEAIPESPPRDGSSSARFSPSESPFRKPGRSKRITPDIRAAERAPVPLTGYGQLDAFIADLFAELRRLDEDVDGLALITNDGEPIASFLPDSLEDWVAAETVWSALKNSRLAAAAFDRGDPVQIVLSAERGYVIIHVIGNDAAIALTCGPKAKLGMILHGLQETSAGIGPAVKAFIERPLLTAAGGRPTGEAVKEADDSEPDGSGVTVEVYEI